ncbi:MAG: hypothetical protein KDD35_09280, partial [Bdellovibrionales bacterium]|nr:hypothetical protein [Bdellovibrionales bacterium]
EGKEIQAQKEAFVQKLYSDYLIAQSDLENIEVKMTSTLSEIQTRLWNLLDEKSWGEGGLREGLDILRTELAQFWEELEFEWIERISERKENANSGQNWDEEGDAVDLGNEGLRHFQELKNQNGEYEPSQIVPDALYKLNGLPAFQHHIFHVSFGSNVVDYLRTAIGLNPRRFLSVIEKGFCGEKRCTGIKRLINSSKQRSVVEIKLVGRGKTERLVGCYDGGLLRVLLVDWKHKFQGTEFKSLCD